MIAAALLALAVLLLVPGRPRRRPRVTPGSFAAARGVRPRMPARLLRGRSRRAARAAALRWADALVAELMAGRPPRVAIVTASVGVDPPCRSTLAAAGLGGDVAAALRDDARTSGVSLLARVAACWSVAESSGAGLAVSLDRAVASARADEEVRGEVESQLAAPRATARLLAVLPLAGILLGSSLGVSPLGWLLGSPIGWLVLLSGLSLIAVGLWWTARLVAAIERDIGGA